MRLALDHGNDPATAIISPMMEMGAYEALWLQPSASFKTIAERFARDPEALPSSFVSPASAREHARRAMDILNSRNASQFGIRIHHAGDYPLKLRDARHPVELLYYQGDWELSELPSVAVVGSRKASDEGLRRARRIATELVKAGFAVASGLAAGIDRAAHEAAIEEGGFTIAVIGTPIGFNYPRENAALQSKIAGEHLLISQVPILRYTQQNPSINRFFFPERNITMSALTEATVIVEASDTSGTLTQARAALHQGRKLFILDSCFQRDDIRWPARFEEQGAIRVRTMADILNELT